MSNRFLIELDVVIENNCYSLHRWINEAFVQKDSERLVDILDCYTVSSISLPVETYIDNDMDSDSIV